MTLQMNDAELLKKAASKRKKRRDTVVKLAEPLQKIMDRKISPAADKFGAVAQYWRQNLPEDLKKHCRIKNLENGKLKVAVDSPVYLYQMKMMSTMLLKDLKASCPKARIKYINFVVGQ